MAGGCKSIIEKNDMKETMKNIKLLCIGLLAAFTLIACDDKDEGTQALREFGYDGSVVGCWHLTAWHAPADIYMEFRADGSFELVQRYLSPEYERLTGRYTFGERMLLGVYSDGTAWSSGYRAMFNADQTQMSLAGDSGISIFTKIEHMPDEVLDAAVRPSQTTTRAGERGARFF